MRLCTISSFQLKTKSSARIAHVNDRGPVRYGGEREEHAGDGTRSTDESFFDFFGLPPELRNLIYGELTEDVPMKTRDFQSNLQGIEGRADAYLRDKPILNRLLLNHHFKDEYGAEVKHRQNVVFADFCYTGKALKLNGAISRTTRATFRFTTDCFEDDTPRYGMESLVRVRWHAMWITRVLQQLIAMRYVKFEFYPCSTPSSTQPHVERSYGNANKVPVVLQQYFKFRGVLELEIYPVFASKLDAKFRMYDRNRPIQSKWIRDTTSVEWRQLV